MAFQTAEPGAPAVGPGSPPLTDGTVKPDIVAVTSALIRACGECAHAATASLAGPPDGRDAKDLGQAALFFAQAVITLDPSRLPGGAHPGAVLASSPPPPITPPGLPTVDRNHDGRIGQQ